MGLCGAIGVMGCSDLAGRQALPAGTPDPSIYNTIAGARGMRNSALVQLSTSVPDYIVSAGLITDELESALTGKTSSNSAQDIVNDGLDGRILPEGQAAKSDQVYGELQGVRALINQATGALATYDTTADGPVLRGELYALQGYAEMLLADLFCSGVPLSTLDYQGDFTYKPGSTTTQIYQGVIAKEDSALRLASANDTIVNLARILTGRALVALGQYAAAGQMVASVPDDFHYRLDITFRVLGGDNNSFPDALLSDAEGQTGVPYLSSGDPRTADTVIGTSPYNQAVGVPNRYKSALELVVKTVPFFIADGIEARLIQAEAALQANPGDPTWLAILNRLRTTATIPGMTSPFAPSDTLTDPGSGSSLDSARIALLFQERAAWLYLTGHRQGDLRRLVRQYHEYGFEQEQAYPTGPYLAPGTGFYGSDVTAPVPSAEVANPLFHGCLDRHA
jgi:hypothetical protein